MMLHIYSQPVVGATAGHAGSQGVAQGTETIYPAAVGGRLSSVKRIQTLRDRGPETGIKSHP